jgi:AcrR family transcriptional regulator
MPSTRDALLDAATGLLDKGGPEAVTLREVGRRAGVSHNAPYKHFADKEALLAAVAARELKRQRWAAPGVGLRNALTAYVAWALAHPARFKLVFGTWHTGSAELAAAAGGANAAFVGAVATAQQGGELPAGEPARVAALVRSVAHGAVDLALAGHLAAGGKGGADPQDLVDDLLDHLAEAAR